MQDSYRRILQDAFASEALRTSELPNLELYMDQVITLIGEHYHAPERGKKSKKHKPLTKTMINNYSKEGLIKPIRGKKYSREHILQMLVVYHMKEVLSIHEIKNALEQLYAQPEYNAALLTSIYEKALASKALSREKLPNLLEHAVQSLELNTDTTDGQFAALLSLTMLIESLQSLARDLAQKLSREEDDKQ